VWRSGLVDHPGVEVSNEKWVSLQVVLLPGQAIVPPATTPKAVTILLEKKANPNPGPVLALD